MVRALTQPDQRDIGTLPRRDGADLAHVDLAGDHLVPEGGHYGRDEGEPIAPLVGDQHAKMVCLAIAHPLLDTRV